MSVLPSHRPCAGVAAGAKRSAGQASSWAGDRPGPVAVRLQRRPRRASGGSPRPAASSSGERRFAAPGCFVLDPRHQRGRITRI
ncbi:MAG: hypothetical protein ACREEZ_11810, partial [Stellaceae bacterium]